jgi:cell wall-associated NlpC family hydrolase
MKKIIHFSLSIVLILFCSCRASRKTTVKARPAETNAADIRSTVKLTKKIPAQRIHTNDVSADSLVQFAETLIGVPYKYGSMDKNQGFDCSGFINYVFQHYRIKVPRRSEDFTNAGKEVPIAESMRGDLILFTGSNPTSGVVGHMGIITENKKGIIRFIHSASGNGVGVMISGMNRYFVERFVKVIRVFAGLNAEP